MSEPIKLPFSSYSSIDVNSDYLGGANLGFEMAGHLISALSHHEMTLTLLNLLERFPGVNSVTCYEVFEVESPQPGRDSWLFRRFPLTLDDNYEDENTRAIVAMLFNKSQRVLIGNYQSRDIVLLRVDEVIPKRIIFIEGLLSEHYQTLVCGLHTVYAKQTLLLDTKERDSLTHLLNRQSLDQILTQILQYHRDHSQVTQLGVSSWLAVLDIDNFKRINDTYGHIFGDEILIHFANLLNETIRFSDFLFRFGGEEFIIILNQIDEGGASKTFERFRKAIQDYDFPAGKVTASIGYTKIDCNKSSEQILEEADRAVYGAKSAGRNKVVDYRELKGVKLSDESTGGIELF